VGAEVNWAVVNPSHARVFHRPRGG